MSASPASPAPHCKACPSPFQTTIPENIQRAASKENTLGVLAAELGYFVIQYYCDKSSITWNKGKGVFRGHGCPSKEIFLHSILDFALILELQGASESQIESPMSEPAQDKDRGTHTDHFGLII